MLFINLRSAQIPLSVVSEKFYVSKEEIKKDYFVMDAIERMQWTSSYIVEAVIDTLVNNYKDFPGKIAVIVPNDMHFSCELISAITVAKRNNKDLPQDIHFYTYTAKGNYFSYINLAKA